MAIHDLRDTLVPERSYFQVRKPLTCISLSSVVNVQPHREPGVKVVPTLHSSSFTIHCTRYIYYPRHLPSVICYLATTNVSNCPEISLFVRVLLVSIFVKQNCARIKLDLIYFFFFFNIEASTFKICYSFICFTSCSGIVM